MIIQFGTYFGVGDIIVAGTLLHGLAKSNDDVKFVVEESNEDKLSWIEMVYPNILLESAWDYQTYWQEEKRNIIQNSKVWCDLEIAGSNRHEAWASNVGTKPVPYQLKVPNEARVFAKEFLRDKHPCILISPVSRNSLNNWPLAYWESLCEMLSDAGVKVLINENEYVPCGCFGVGPNSLGRFEKIPTTDPARVAAIIEQADLVIGADCGFVHIAGTLNRPCIAIVAPSSGVKTFGWYNTVKIIEAASKCSSCYAPFKPRPKNAMCKETKKFCPLLFEIRPELVYSDAMQILDGNFSKEPTTIEIE